MGLTYRTLFFRGDENEEQSVIVVLAHPHTDNMLQIGNMFKPKKKNVKKIKRRLQPNKGPKLPRQTPRCVHVCVSNFS